MKIIREVLQLKICFDGTGQQIEELDVHQITDNTYRVAENPIFTEQVSFGDIIKVRREQDIYYYMETMRKSDYKRYTWLLSKSAMQSEDIEKLKIQISEMNGKWETVFGGFLVVNLPKNSEFNLVQELNKIVAKFDKLEPGIS